MTINTSTVHRNLDAKFKIGSIEAFDLLIALIAGAVMNLCFSGTTLELPLVIGVPVLVLATLYFSKRGKPEKHMLYLMRFYLAAGFFAAGQELDNAMQVRRKIYA
ncbi:MAG: hypothetical protein OYH77_07455 [Pseudomonadota bacterium]|nr:hypothetical protein [Pseudomonadota bacterium]